MIDPLLSRAIVASSPEEASSAWSEWRNAVDIGSLPWSAAQLLPAVYGRLNGLLAEDPCAGILQGIVRRAWTEAQLRLSLARSIAGGLRDSGCDPVVFIGSAGIFLLKDRENTVRPISEIRLLVRREQVQLAAQSLLIQGWSLTGRIPHGNEFDWSNSLFLSREGVALYLHWRPIPWGGADLENAVFEDLNSKTSGGHEYTVLSPAFALLAVLGSEEEEDSNAIPWHVDAALLAREPIDWQRWAALAQVHAPFAFARVRRLSELGLSLAIEDHVSEAKRSADSLPLTVIDGKTPAFAVWWREHREYSTLLRYLAVRDLRLRFRSLPLGLLWTVLQPLVPAVIFALVFARVLQSTMAGVPYSLFAAAGLALWTFFSSSVSSASMAFVWNSNLLHKVYFPRAILPASAILATSVELSASCLLLAAYALYCGYSPRWSWLVLPFAAGALAGLAFFVSLALATLNALHREVKFAVPFALQVWMYASPVVYPAGLLPDRVRWMLGLNPLTGILETFRWALFGVIPDATLLWMSMASALIVTAAAALLFRSLEGALTDRL